MIVKTAADAWNLLNGICCIVKPRETSTNTLCKLIVKALCKELNEFDEWEPKTYNRPVFTEDKKTLLLKIKSYKQQIDYSDHPLVIGINSGCDLIAAMKRLRPLSEYHITGMLGRATIDHSVQGKIVEKSTYKHVTCTNLNRVLAKLTANNLKAAFDSAGVDLQSQKAFELASQGLVRPREDSFPIFYKLCVVQFRKPFFTMKVKCVNEDEASLKSLVHEVGLSAKTTAACVSIRRVRHGHFSLQHALLVKQISLQNIINNLITCQRIWDWSQQNCQNTSTIKRRPLPEIPTVLDLIPADDNLAAVEEEEEEECTRNDNIQRKHHPTPDQCDPIIFTVKHAQILSKHHGQADVSDHDANSGQLTNASDKHAGTQTRQP
ncbi:putative tRNA pseudouridine synthase 2 [Trichinella nativa]|uniref:tRNA pseudouridine synthase 2 n=1 Tax=Trichinella nativa TaxID=6335 RepID=A0A0V1LSI3_9BILA|nr:putative tRNA pseudouridine synthase 2 [Trichinella sp. T6]KRZ62490.1 putative tRNA pseudouridine synthase 2 [Trichinella nativa]